MKKKKLSKLIQLNLSKFHNKKQKIEVKAHAIKENYVSNDYMFTESTDEFKNKIRNLIIRLLGKRDQLEHNINENIISMHNRYDVVKNNSISKSFSFHIEIIKNVGFTLNCNDRRILMKDISLYDDIKPKVKEIFDEINKENFDELYKTILKENGLSRDSNLDELLKGY